MTVDTCSLVTRLTRVHSLTGHVTIVTMSLGAPAGRLTTDQTPRLPPHALDLPDLLGVGDDQEVSPASVVDPPLPDEPPQRPVHGGRHVPRLPDAGEVCRELLEYLGHVGRGPGHLKLEQDPADGVTQRSSRAL